MSNFKMNSVENFVINIKSGTFGADLVSVTIPQMSATKRTTHEINPFNGKIVEKVTYYKNITVGYHYDTNVNLSLERDGKEPNFVTEKVRGQHWIYFPKILAADRDENIHYIRLTKTPTCLMESKTIYLIDGKPCHDKKTIEAIHYWDRNYKSFSKKQADLGLTPDKQVHPFSLGVEHIYLVRQGEKEWINKSGKYDLDTLLEFLKF